MIVSPLNAFSLQQIQSIFSQGEPWLPQQTDYWLWQTCFASTSFIAAEAEALAGGVLACLNQDALEEVYVDQVAVDRAWRGRGVTGLLLEAVCTAARRRGCKKVWLSTDPANPATQVWPRYGFLPLGVKPDFKGPGKDRALFERSLA